MGKLQPAASRTHAAARADEERPPPSVRPVRPVRPQGSGKENLPLAITQGDCIGGVTIDVTFRDATSPLNDPQGNFCNVFQKGFNLYSFGYGIAVNRALPEPVYRALDFLAVEARTYAEFSEAYDANFPLDRLQCGDGVDLNALQPVSLSVEDMAGVFLLQGFGVVGALLWVGVAKLFRVPVMPAADVLLRSPEKEPPGGRGGLLRAMILGRNSAVGRSKVGPAAPPSPGDVKASWRSNDASAFAANADAISTVRAQRRGGRTRRRPLPGDPAFALRGLSPLLNNHLPAPNASANRSASCSTDWRRSEGPRSGTATETAARTEAGAQRGCPAIRRTPAAAAVRSAAPHHLLAAARRHWSQPAEELLVLSRRHQQREPLLLPAGLLLPSR